MTGILMLAALVPLYVDQHVRRIAANALALLHESCFSFPRKFSLAFAFAILW